MPLSRQIKPPRTVRATKNRRAAQAKSVFFTKKFICEKRANARKNEKIEDRICVNRRGGIFFPKRLDTVRKVWYTVTRKEITNIERIFTMSTFMAKKESVERKWYVLDAKGKPLGRTAAAAANILRGKHRPEFTPHVDCGEFVIIINAAEAVLTGRKLEQKFYRRHSGYIGGLKEVNYKTLMATKPTLAMELAVKGMLPHNSIGDKSITRLKVYAGAEHDNAAQKPEAYEF